jgi:nucleotide-binding universal stress UspA family protein
MNIHLSSAITPDAGTNKQEILVPIDFSASSIAALRHATTLAAGGKARLTLVNVIEGADSFRRLDTHAHHCRLLEEPERRLKQLARREIGSGIAVSVVIRQGRPSRVITRLATQHHADLIVVGRHQHHGLRKWLNGHTASRVANRAPCPVLVLN